MDVRGIVINCVSREEEIYDDKILNKIYHVLRLSY